MKREFIFETVLPLATIVALTVYGLTSSNTGVTVIAALIGFAFIAASIYFAEARGGYVKTIPSPPEPTTPTILLPPEIIAHLQARRYSKNDWTDDEFAWMLSLIVANFTISAPTVERDSRS